MAGVPLPQHLSGQSLVYNYLFPGGLQPLATGLSVLSYTKAFPNITLPQHLSGQTAVESYLYPGALQPLQIAALAGYPVTWTITITITMD